METIKQYGDLSDKELYSFLDEIENADADIREEERLSALNIEQAQTEELLAELPENAELEAYYGEDAWRDFNKRIVPYGKQAMQKARELTKDKAASLKNDRLRIQRAAFNQENIPLATILKDAEITLLVSLLVADHTKMIEKYEAFINNRLTTLLRPFIPKRLKICERETPQAIKKCPGFLYRASKEFGNEAIFWAEPDIPYYFKQGTECELLQKEKPDFLVAIDRALVSYTSHKTKRAEKELKYVSIIIRKKVRTFYDLLKLNPFWFELLYNNLITEKL